MMLPFFLAEVATKVDSVSTYTGLIGNLGIGGAVLMMARYFLGYLEKQQASRDAEQGRRDAERAKENTDRDKRWEELADRYADVIKDNSQAMRQVSASMNTICRITNGGPPK